MEVKSPAFLTGNLIPAQYTCDGEDISPPLQWDAPPPGAKSFALVVEDPDAPNRPFTHWVLYNLPAECSQLPENIAKASNLLKNAVQGKNDFGNLGFGGPCPPSGSHRYFFKLFALSQALNLPPGATKRDLLKAMDGHVLDTAELMGRYARQR